MITLLRKIRRSLIESGSARKYMLYAIGEIVLVVVGILIALQINNWNEQKKTAVYEQRLLQGLHNSIENELPDWNFILDNNYEGDSSYQIIVQVLDAEIPYEKSLNRDFNKALNIWYHELNTTAYETIKGYGLNFIQNQQNVDHLSDMYERWQKIYKDRNYEKNAFFNSIAAPHLFDLFERKIGTNGYEYVPINTQQVINDTKFRSILEQQQIFRKEIIRWQETILEDLHESLELIESEMTRY